MMELTKTKGPHLVRLGRETVAHSTADGSLHMPASRGAPVGSAPVVQDDGTITWQVVDAATATLVTIESFPRGDIIWQTDPGGLWDSGKCFVHMFATIGRARLVCLDFQFGAPGTGADGKWGVWGGIDSTGSWTLLGQGPLPNTVKGIRRYTFPAALDISAYDSIAVAQDPGASGVTQPVRQAALYYSPNPPTGIPAAYSYIGNHVHNDAFAALPTITAADATYLMQKWTAIGVR